MSWKALIPGVWAGPTPNSSPIPIESITGSTFGCSKRAFTSEAKIKSPF